MRLDELLDWLGARLALQWQAVAVPAAPAAAALVPPDAPAPAREQLLALREVVDLGYPRGVQRQLEQIERERPDCAAWLAAAARAGAVVPVRPHDTR